MCLAKVIYFNMQKFEIISRTSLFWVVGFNCSYNFLLFLFTKDKSYIHSALMGVSFICLLISGIFFNEVLTRNFLFVTGIGYMVSSYFSIYYYIKFISSIYIDIPKKTEKILKLNIQIISFMFLIFVSVWIIFFLFIKHSPLPDKIFIVSSFTVLLEVVYTLVSFIRNKLYKTAGFRLLVFGQCVFALGIGLSFIPEFFDVTIPNTLGISFLIFSSLFSISIADKINSLKEQTEQAQEKALEKLEQKVVERTQEVQSQKHLIEEKHREITDSINYAERIQRSFLATKEHLDANLNEYFVLFKPKDVVSGDFYWSATLKNGLFALVTADSTGHGVPGAIMSLLNISGLEKAIETNTQPADILNSTRTTIIERLKKDGSVEGGKDGMDASLTVYDFKNKKLFIAAANNPVWIVRETETIEIKPDKMPIGKHDRDSVSFTQQEVDLKSGDVIYTLTDGFPDQFGGESGKKFMIKRLRKFIAANAHLSMTQQKQLLENTFANWVGNIEQVDDVCLIGVRV